MPAPGGMAGWRAVTELPSVKGHPARIRATRGQATTCNRHGVAECNSLFAAVLCCHSASLVNESAPRQGIVKNSDRVVLPSVDVLPKVCSLRDISCGYFQLAIVDQYSLATSQQAEGHSSIVALCSMESKHCAAPA
jgi:hypothetical protein